METSTHITAQEQDMVAFRAETARIQAGERVGNIVSRAVDAQMTPRGDEAAWMAWKGVD